MSDDDEKIIRISTFENETKEAESKKDEEYDLSGTIEIFTHNMRMMYLDHMSDPNEEEIDTELIKASEELKRELRYVIYDGGKDMELYLHLYLENWFDQENTPYSSSWFSLISSDDMRINALRIILSIQDLVCLYFARKLDAELIKKTEQKNEKE